MKKILVVVAMAFMVMFAPAEVGAADVLNPTACQGLSQEQRVAAGCNNAEGGLESKIPGIVSAILWIAGVLAVGMIIYAGVRMIISQGDAGKVAQERQTIVYAVVGLVVTLLAYVIVGFVVGEFTGGGGNKETEGDNSLVEGGNA